MVFPNRVPGQLLPDPNSNTYSKPNPNPNRRGNFPWRQLFGHPLTEAYLKLSWISYLAITLLAKTVNGAVNYFRLNALL